MPPTPCWSAARRRVGRSSPGPGLAVHPALLRIAFEFWLLPRRFTDRVGDAQWLIIYGRGVPRPAVEVRRRISLGPAATLLEVAR